MTEEVGAVSGTLTLRTTPDLSSRSLRVEVGYDQANEFYTVEGSPVLLSGRDPNLVHELVENELLPPNPGVDEYGNPRVVDISKMM